jgi:polyphosphate kinase 2 (PPK2 family)
LKEWDPGDTSAFDGGEEEAEERLLKLNRQLEDLQELLYAEHKNRLLVALQAMDTGGKDGTIRHVFEELIRRGEGRLFQGAHTGRAGPRFPLAGAQADARHG